jgi:hypothetical protein
LSLVAESALGIAFLCIHFPPPPLPPPPPLYPHLSDVNLYITLPFPLFHMNMYKLQNSQKIVVVFMKNPDANYQNAKYSLVLVFWKISFFYMIK